MFTGSSVSRQLLRVCELSEIAFLLHTSIIAKNKNRILYFYVHTCSSLLITTQYTIQHPDNTVCISHSANTAIKGMCTTILPLCMLNSRVDCTILPFYDSWSSKKEALNSDQIKSAKKVTLCSIQLLFISILGQLNRSF